MSRGRLTNEDKLLSSVYISVSKPYNIKMYLVQTPHEQLTSVRHFFLASIFSPLHLFCSLYHSLFTKFIYTVFTFSFCTHTLLKDLL